MDCSMRKCLTNKSVRARAKRKCRINKKKTSLIINMTAEVFLLVTLTLVVFLYYRFVIR